MTIRRDFTISSLSYAGFAVWVPVLTMFIIGLSVASGQTYLYDNVQLTNTTSNQTVLMAKPTSIATSQSIVMPTTAPTVGQILAISSVSSPTINLGWSNIAAGSKPPSDRVIGAKQSGNPPDGLTTSLAASKSYAFRGFLIVNRAAGGSDNFRVTVTAPTGTLNIDLSIRCYDCPTGTATFPVFSTVNNGTTLNSVTIDPAGSGTTNTNAFTYGIEGLVETGATAGTLNITVSKPAAEAANSINVELGLGSHYRLTEVK